MGISIPGRVQLTSRRPAGDHLLFITIIIGFLAIPGNPNADPHSPRAAREDRSLFITFIIFIMLTTILSFL